MATTSDRRISGDRTGGKIVRNRRIPANSRTPYDRPSKPVEQSTMENRDSENPNWLSGLIYPAKIIASGAGKFLSLFVPDSSSSSSDDDTSENDDEEEFDNDASFQGNDQSNKALLASNKSDNKCAIEQLVMQETFSRKEGNELVKLIKSRVVDTNDKNVANTRSTEIAETRKWLRQKRSGSKKKMEHEFDAATPVASSNGSPVDMAKSYMQNRPGWASPLFKEETAKSILSKSEMKRSHLSSGSWNIMEEIQRVRSKAAENLLAATPLTKTGLSPFSSDVGRPQGFLMNNRAVEGAAVAESTLDRPQNVLPDVPESCPSRINKDDGAIQMMEDQEYQEVADLESNEVDEVNVLRSRAAENGFPSTSSGLIAGQDATTQNPGPSKEVNGNLIVSSQITKDIYVEGNSKPEPEPAENISNANPSDSVINGSQNSSSMHQEDLSQELGQPNIENISKAKAKAKAKNAAMERKSRVYALRGRERG